MWVCQGRPRFFPKGEGSGPAWTGAVLIAVQAMLMGIGLAVPVAATLDEDVIAVSHSWTQSPWFKLPSLILVAGALTLLYKLALKREPIGTKKPPRDGDKPLPEARVLERDDK